MSEDNSTPERKYANGGREIPRWWGIAMFAAVLAVAAAVMIQQAPNRAAHNPPAATDTVKQ